MDPLSVAIAGASIVVGSFVHSIGGRLAQRVIPTQFDTAQIEGVELQKKRFAAEDERFHIQLEESRARLLLEHKHRLEHSEFVHQLQRWPLAVSPSDFIRMSSQKGASPLNVILKVSDQRRNPKDADSQRALTMLQDAALILEDQALQWFNEEASDGSRYNSLIFYRDFALRQNMDGQALVATLSSLVSTEPTVLIEVSLRDQLSYRFTLSHWGESLSESSGASTSTPFILNLLQHSDDPARQQVILSALLSSVVIGIADVFRLTRRPHLLPSPVLPALMQLGSREEKAEAYWKPITNTYLTILDCLAKRSPLLASEIAANAALVAHHAGQIKYAKHLYLHAKEYFTRGRKVSNDDMLILACLKRTRAISAQPYKLEEALILIGGISAEDIKQDKIELDNIFSTLKPTALRTK